MLSTCTCLRFCNDREHFRAVLHDPSVFEDPEEFKPERFEDSKERPAEPDIVQAAFGFGRR